MLPWLLCGALALAVLLLLFRLGLARKSLDELVRELGERLYEPTNNLLFVPCRDRQIRKLANILNRQLKELRLLRRKYENGDRELKNAVTNLSHDLRTPLAAVYGYLDLLEREEVSPAAARYLEIIRDRAELMEGLTEELFRCSLVLAGEEPPHREAVVVNAVLEESLGGFYAILKERGIVPVVTLPQERVVRWVDRTDLSRIFANLLSNAAKYSGGDLTVQLTGEGEVTFSNAAPDLGAVEVERLFDRFYTVETARSSTGLGLSIARTLTERMGGTLHAEYESRRLTFRLTLPQE